MTPLPPSVGDLFDDQEEADAFFRTMHPYVQVGFKKGIDQIAPTATVDVFTTAVQRALREKAYRHAVDVIGTTKEALSFQISESIRLGEGITELSKRIDTLFESQASYRSTRIARTELTDTINDGVSQTLKSEGYPLKEWSTVLDNKERDTHHEADGQQVPSNETFQVGGSSARYPGDDHLPPEERINCRCTLVGGGTPEDRKRHLGRMFLRVHGSLERKFVLSLRRAFAAERRRVISRLAT